MASAEAEVLEAAALSQIDGQSNGYVSDLPSLESSLWTENYVRTQAKLLENEAAEMHKAPPSFDKPPGNIVDPPVMLITHTPTL